MSNGRQTLGRKTRTRGHVIADLSANFLERVVLEQGHVAQRTVHDYGIDHKIYFFDENGRIENGEVSVQLKATDSPRYLRRTGHVSITLSARDLAHWLEEAFPVILVLYDAKRDVAFWEYVQRAYGAARLSSATQSLRIPLTQRLDRTAVEQFRSFRNKNMERKYTQDRPPKFGGR